MAASRIARSYSLPSGPYERGLKTPRQRPVQSNRNVTRERHLQSSDTIMVIEPIGFKYNPDAALDNKFMHQSNLTPEEDERLALQEFEAFCDALIRRGVNVLRFPGDRSTPDAVFPDWLLTYYNVHTNKRTLALCPMLYMNRRLERRDDIISHFERYFEIHNLTAWEHEEKALEGKGALCISRRLRKAFINLSGRSSREVAEVVCERAGLELITFHAFDKDGEPIYHTDVVMTIGTYFIVICEEAIRDPVELQTIRDALAPLNLRWINITLDQMYNFCANIREMRVPLESMGPYYRDESRTQLKKFQGSLLVVVMSQRAFVHYTPEQRSQMEEVVTELVPVPLYHIERTGGGSARCMIAEIFH